jgi:hypothetical protein
VARWAGCLTAPCATPLAAGPPRPHHELQPQTGRLPLREIRPPASRWPCLLHEAKTTQTVALSNHHRPKACIGKIRQKVSNRIIDQRHVPADDWSPSVAGSTASALAPLGLAPSGTAPPGLTIAARPLDLTPTGP